MKDPVELLDVDEPRHTKTGDPGRIAREAELLALARHPGIVALIGIEGDPLHPVLVTRHVDGQVLSEADLSRPEAAGITAAVASTLADLHQLGFVHGGVAPEHVVVGAGGGPVLCSLGHGGRVGESSPGPPDVPAGFVDPDLVEGRPLDPSVDVYALGALLRFLVADSSRPGDRLLRLAEEATAGDPGRRPTAAGLASAINDAVPDACLPGLTLTWDEQSSTPRSLEPRFRSQPGPRSPNVDLDALRRSHQGRPSARRRLLPARRRAGAGWRRWIVGAAIGALVVVGVVLSADALSGTGNDAARSTDEALPPAPPVVDSSSLDSSTSLVPTTAGAAFVNGLAAPPGCPPVDPMLAADTDGDGCPEELRYAAGTLEAGSARWSVGDDGDQVATGDWACRGQTDLALLHPPTGDVFVFDGWAPPAHDLVATAVTRVEGGFALRAADLRGPGCQRLVVDRRDGPPVAVPIRPDE